LIALDAARDRAATGPVGAGEPSPHGLARGASEIGPAGGATFDPVAAGRFAERIEEMEGPAPRIMLVDDDRDFREMLRDLLIEDGFDVVGEASDGGEAARLAGEVMPDVILMDLRMPNVDGIEGTRLLKTVLPLVQVIMLSAYGDLGLQRGAQEAGVYCYLIKGCPPGMIREMLRFAWKYKLGLERGLSASTSPSSSPIGLWSEDDLDLSFGPNPGWGGDQPPR
jgi:CheY-like chemotaxis protein